MSCAGVSTLVYCVGSAIAFSPAYASSDVSWYVGVTPASPFNINTSFSVKSNTSTPSPVLVSSHSSKSGNWPLGVGVGFGNTLMVIVV